LKRETEKHISAQGRSKRRELHPVLVFLNGEMMAVPTPLEREVVVLGRALEADVRINDPKTSRLHAQITTERNSETGEIVYRLFDLQSKNGTLLNGEQISEAVLSDGDKIGIGNHLLRFEMLDDIDREFQMQVYRLLAHDELTGLLSSRSFFFELRREAGRAAANGGAFCVLMMDLDYFKRVNDTYGHVTGSKTLEEASRCIVKSLRAGDVASRFGGEEFAIFLLDADLDQGMVAAERIRRRLEEHEFTVTRQFGAKLPEKHHITISIGVASFPEDSRDPIELVEMADAALYRAKQTGRNRVCSYRQIKERLSGQQQQQQREKFIVD
jgi:two-component system cell cycle response regulator